MNDKEVLNEFNKTWKTLLEKVSTFDEENFNRKPSENKWSAAQVARHLIKSNSALPEMLNGETKETERESDEMIEQIKSDFLNFEIKMDAPDFIVPEDEIFGKKELVEQLEKVQSDILKTSENSDLSKTCLTFEFPGYGFLTGIEVLSFAVFHTRRHLHQLDKIVNAL